MTLAGTTLDITPKPATHFGCGAVERVGPLVTGLDRRTAVVVTDGALAATPVVDAVRDACAASGVDVHVFAGVQPNPTTTDVAAAVTAVRHAGDAAIVAVGGGSSLDVAKGAAVELADTPVVAVPTTAGSGAETNAFGVITDVEERRKTYVGGPTALAAAVVLDPELTVGMPAAVTVSTGVDALTHAVESYCSVRANPWSDGIATQAVRMIAAHLPRAHADGGDVEARAQLLLAANLSGVAMANTGLGICHALAHPLGGRYDVPHGAALAALLPGCLRFNLPVSERRLAELAYAFRVGDTSSSDARNAAATLHGVDQLLAELDAGAPLADHGVEESALPELADDALADAVLANTPRQPAHADAVALLRGAGLPSSGA